MERTTEKLLSELDSGLASRPTDILLPRPYAGSDASYLPDRASDRRKGLLYRMRRHAKNIAAGLGVAYMLAGLPGCGQNPSGPTNGNSSFSIRSPESGKNAGTPIEVSYEFNDSAGRASYAEFALDGGRVLRDETLDGSYVIDGNTVPGGHTIRGYLVDASGSIINGADSSVSFNVNEISGNVTDRIAGGAVSGSTIAFNGPSRKSAQITNGRYSVTGLAEGIYAAAISGGNHMEHRTQSMAIGNSANFPFSVLARSPGRFGVVIDNAFERYFDLITRLGTGKLRKWIAPPTKLYVTEEGLSQANMEDFITLLREVNNESIPDMYCGRTGPLPIIRGPPIGEREDGTIIVRFVDYVSNALIHYRDTFDAGVIAGARVAYNITEHSTGRPVWERKNDVAHELFHAAYARHAFDTYRRSLMGGSNDITALSPEDKLASCIVNHNDTHPGNRAPDTNPTYFVN